MMAAIQGRKKKLKIRYRLSVVFFATVLIFGLTFYRYMKTTTLEDVLSENRTITVFKDNTTVKKDGSAADQTDDADTAPEASAAVKVVNPIAETPEPKDNSYLDSCVFVGDSIAYGMGSYNVVPSSRVFASVSLSVTNADTAEVETSGGSKTILEALDSEKPENIYVIFSGSSAAYTTSAVIYQSYSAFLNKIRLSCPDSKLYVISTPPVTEGKENSATSPVKNSYIDSLNESLLKYCNDYGVRYLDLNTAFKNESGKLIADYAENDGLHFKSSAYNELISYVLSHVAD